MPIRGKKPFVPAKCPKCSSVMNEVRAPMALVSVRRKGIGLAAQLQTGAPGMIVTPRRCPHCDYVELFAPKRPALPLVGTRARFARVVVSLAKN